MCLHAALIAAALIVAALVFWVLELVFVAERKACDEQVVQIECLKVGVRSV